jgi:hypothetical protein
MNLVDPNLDDCPRRHDDTISHSESKHVEEPRRKYKRSLTRLWDCDRILNRPG